MWHHGGVKDENTFKSQIQAAFFTFTEKNGWMNPAQIKVLNYFGAKLMFADDSVVCRCESGMGNKSACFVYYDLYFLQQ